jgi:hypothetical protein
VEDSLPHEFREETFMTKPKVKTRKAKGSELSKLISILERKVKLLNREYQKYLDELARTGG